MRCKIAKRKLWPFEFSAWREKAQLDFTRAKFARDQAVKTELDRIAAHELLAHSRESRLRCSPCRRKRFLVSRFVIDNPNVLAVEMGVVRPISRENEIDPSADPKVTAIQQNNLRRFQYPFGRHLRPAI